MALQPCFECGQQVSTEAAACPSCGAPVRRPQVSPQEYANKLTSRPADAPLWSTPDGSVPSWVKGAGWVVGGILLIGAAVAGVGAAFAPAHSDTAATEAPGESPTTATRPPHNYSRVYGNMYGYQPAPNLSQRQQGMPADALQPLLVRFDGDSGGIARFMILAPTGLGVLYECARPFQRCEMTSAPGWTDVAPGTILDAILQDVANDYLKPIPGPPAIKRIPG